MNTLFGILNHPLTHRIGWALLHSLWQGALVGAVFALLRFALRNRSANARYVAGCLSLGVLVAFPVLTLLLGAMPSAALGSGPLVMSTFTGGALPSSSAGVPQSSYTTIGADSFWHQGTDFLGQVAPLLAAAWLLGVAFSSARLARSCWWVKNIRIRGNEPIEAAWTQTLNELCHRLGVSRPVSLLNSALVEVPTVIGWFRPVILLPVATLSGLTPSQVEAILVHELAHVRRLDYVVNAFQCLVETLMFYHPVAWWISRYTREERENCCDDLVIQVCADRLAYARALAAMEGLRAELPDLVFAASGGSLLNRIRRLLGVPNDKGSVSCWQVARLALLGITLVIIALGVRLAVGSHPLSVTFLRWSDTPVFPANVPDEFRSRFPKGEYALLGVRNNGSRSLRFNSRAVEYDSDGRWIKVIPKQWLGMDGYGWDGGGLGSIVWLTQPSEVPRGVRWRIRYVCALDVSRDANAALRRILNQIAGKVLGTNTLAFCAPVEMVSPEIPPANVQDGATNGRQPLRSETGRQPTPTISFAGIEPGRTYRAAGFYVTNCTRHAILMRRVQVQAAADGDWKTLSENQPDASSILEAGSSSIKLSPLLEAGEYRKIVVEWPEEPPWRVCLFYGQEQKGVKALKVKARAAWVAHPKDIWQVAYWRARVWGGAGQVTSREVAK